MSNPTPEAGAWWHQPLDTLTPEQWEALCDGCGKCCLLKLEDIDQGILYYTNVVCRYFDRHAGGCTVYPERNQRVPECVIVRPGDEDTLRWMPATCAYRLREEGKPLPPWHPLVSGDPDSVIRAGHTMVGRVVGEEEVDDLEHHLMEPFA